MPSRKSPPGQAADWPRPLLPIPRLRNSALPVGILQCPGSSDSPLPAPDRPHAYTDQLRPGWSRFTGWHRPRLAGRIGGHPVGDAEKCTGSRSATNRTRISACPSAGCARLRARCRAARRGSCAPNAAACSEVIMLVAEQNQRWCAKDEWVTNAVDGGIPGPITAVGLGLLSGGIGNIPYVATMTPLSGCGPRCRVADGERASPRRRTLRGCRVSSPGHRTLRRCGGAPARSPRAGRRTWTDAARGSRFPGASVRRRSTRSSPDRRV
jgi:hypothetical protein